LAASTEEDENGRQFRRWNFTPNNFNPDTVSGLQWPTGLLPKLANQLPNIAIIRSMHAWALVQSLAQTRRRSAGTFPLVDERRAGRTAAAAGITVMGPLGVVAQAKQAKLIDLNREAEVTDQESE
jgi:hypothetical protein